MHALDELELTTPEDALRTVQVHETAFAHAGQSDAFTRVIAAVVQPGVEFGSHNVVDYNSSKAEALSATLKDMPGLVFEALHRLPDPSQLDRSGAGRLRHPQGWARPDLRPAGGPLRPRRDRGGAFPARRDETLRATMERIMLASPENWASTTTAVLPSWPCSGISRTATACATTGHSRRLTRPWRGYSRF